MKKQSTIEVQIVLLEQDLKSTRCDISNVLLLDFLVFPDFLAFLDFPANPVLLDFSVLSQFF